MNNSSDQEAVEFLKLTLSYNGAPFSGFARQPGQLTVQGEIEQALSTIFAQDIETVCAGRTDAGVHARGQVVSFSVPKIKMAGRELDNLQRSINALTDDAIVVRSIDFAPIDFSARFDAVARKYRYFICNQDVPSIFMNDFSWFIPGNLDLDAMREGAKYLIGEHDFRSFCVAISAKDKTTFRNVSRIEIDEKQIMGDKFVVVTVMGNAFLHSMVRTIVGTLVAVGRGKRAPAWVDEALCACDRKAAGETAPAKGLIFWKVEY